MKNKSRTSLTIKERESFSLPKDSPCGQALIGLLLGGRPHSKNG